MPLLENIKRKTNVEFRPATEQSIHQLRALGVPEEVLSFYRDSEPSECAEINKVRIWPIADIWVENKDYVPGADLCPMGLVVFATTEKLTR